MPNLDERLVDVLEKLYDVVRDPKPEDLKRTFDWKKFPILTTATQQFLFNFVPEYFVVYVPYSTGALTFLFQEGAAIGLSAADSGAVPLLDGLILQIPARDRVCTITNTSGSTITALVFALGPNVDFSIAQAK